MSESEIKKYLKNSIDEKGNYCYSLPVETTKAVIKELDRLNNIIKELKYYKKQYKNIINRINSDYKGYKQQFLNLKWLEQDNVEHSDAYKQLQYLLWYIEELKEYK